MRTAEEVQAYFYKEWTMVASVAMKGPNRSLLLFYPNFGKHSLVVQVWEGTGFEVYANNASNKIVDTLEWLKQLRLS